jgi:hypothetical protein
VWDAISEVPITRFTTADGLCDSYILELLPSIQVGMFGLGHKIFEGILGGVFRFDGNSWSSWWP